MTASGSADLAPIESHQTHSPQEGVWVTSGKPRRPAKVMAEGTQRGREGASAVAARSAAVMGRSFTPPTSLFSISFGKRDHGEQGSCF